ncbi:hypothetical protein Bca52824_041942 [Brassica carinata]|uniref:Uncharacterized protein n=1 Tax=Brassica carinata TaxID=52824 RepID=A0A8X7RWF3_BRACI|nr:hypothetical protein Bca52824_041942 [Brassica carinata]
MTNKKHKVLILRGDLAAAKVKQWQGKEDRSSATRVKEASRGSGWSGAETTASRSREKQMAVVQEVGEGATMTLNPERLASNPWKKGRGGRQKRFSPVGERPHRQRQIKAKNPNRFGVA